MGGLLVSNTDNSIGGAFRSKVERDGYTWQPYNIDTLSADIDLSLYKWDSTQGDIVIDTAAETQQQIDECKRKLEQIDQRYSMTRGYCEAVLNGDITVNSYEQQRCQEHEDKAQPLRDELSQLQG